MAIHNVQIGSDNDGNGRTSLLPNGAAPGDPEDYRVPVGKKWAITTILFCNTGSYTEADGITNDPDTPNSYLTYLDLHFVKAGDAAGDKNLVLNGIPIPGGETFTFDTEKIILEEGDLVYAQTTSPEVISATLSYLEV